MRDPESFRDFYASSMRRVVSHVHAMTGSWPEAEDAVQEAYARAWARWGKLRGYHDPEAWVRTVAFRACVSSWRKAVNRRAAHHRHGPPPDEAAVSPEYVAIITALRQLAPTGYGSPVVSMPLAGNSTTQIKLELILASTSGSHTGQLTFLAEIQNPLAWDTPGAADVHPHLTILETERPRTDVRGRSVARSDSSQQSVFTGSEPGI